MSARKRLCPSAGAFAASRAAISGGVRLSALEALRKQAEGRAKQEDPMVVRAKAIDALDKEMRAVSAYMGQVGGEISNVRPETGLPYEVLFLGKLPVTLSNA